MYYPRSASLLSFLYFLILTGQLLCARHRGGFHGDDTPSQDPTRDSQSLGEFTVPTGTQKSSILSFLLLVLLIYLYLKIKIQDAKVTTMVLGMLKEKNPERNTQK